MEAIFKALGDTARLTLLDSLRHKDGQTLQQLQGLLDMTRFGVMKHLAVLQDAGLIVTLKRGRYKHHYLNVLPLQQVLDRWIDPLIAKPSARALLNFKSALESTNAMTQAPDFVMQTFIETSHDALWDALTKGDLAAQYHFACQTVQGDLVKNETQSFILPNGSPMLDLTVTDMSPKTRIEMTFTPHFFGPGAPASRCVYIVEPQGPAIKLTVEHYNIGAGQEGISEGWARMMSALKSYLEVGPGKRFGMPMGEDA